MQRDILQMFHFALRPGGHLFLGTSESVDVASELFIPVDKRNRIFRASPARPVIRSSGRQLPGAEVSVALQDSQAKLRPGRKISYAEVHHRALAKRTPPSLILDGDGNILHMSDGVGRFLHWSAASPAGT